MESSLNPLVSSDRLVQAIAIGIELGLLGPSARAIVYRFDLKFPPCSNVPRIHHAGSRPHGPNTERISGADLPSFDRRVVAPARKERPESFAPERQNEYARPS